ncbi:MAG: hypothetical protein ND807_16560 [Vicinamibacterales bacterium]|nr:hypothetical protein [Vicinamibacterales bacterium]
MDVGIRSPLLDFFRRGEVAKDVRLLAARGALAPRAHEQIALLVMLTEDGDPEVRAAAESTMASIPEQSLALFLGRSDVPDALREFFRGRGIEPVPGGDAVDEPLIDAEPADPAVPAEAEEGDEEAARVGAAQRLALLNVADRMKAAMKGTKEERAVLIRDPNKLVSVSVLSSPKLMPSEVEAFAKMGNVSEEILRIIGMSRAWTKNYGVISALTKNPKTPLGVSINFVLRLNEKDLKLIAMDRNLQEPLKLAVRKRLTSGPKG